MKCKICGFDMDPNSVFCPMCGTKVSESAAPETAPNPRQQNTENIKKSERKRKSFSGESEFSWNTYDFPKPRELKDIKMEWSGLGVMSNDASEGFVSSEPEIPLSKAVHPDNCGVWHMPEVQPFTAAGILHAHPVWNADLESEDFNGDEKSVPVQPQPAGYSESAAVSPAGHSEPSESVRSRHSSRRVREKDDLQEEWERVKAERAKKAAEKQGAGQFQNAEAAEAVSPSFGVKDLIEQAKTLPERESAAVRGKTSGKEPEASSSVSAAPGKKQREILPFRFEYPDASSAVPETFETESRIPKAHETARPVISKTSESVRTAIDGVSGADRFTVSETSEPEPAISKASELRSRDSEAPKTFGFRSAGQEASKTPGIRPAVLETSESESGILKSCETIRSAVPETSEPESGIPKAYETTCPAVSEYSETQPEASKTSEDISSAAEPVLTAEQIIPPLEPQSESLKSLRMFNTFYSKNEEFQKLLDEEYERIKARGDDELIRPAPLPESIKVPEKDGGDSSGGLSEFDRMIMAGTKPSDEDETMETRLSELRKELSGGTASSAEGAAGKAGSESSAVNAGSEKPGQKPSPLSDMPLSEVSSSMGPAAFSRDSVRLKIKQMKEQEEVESDIRSLRRKKLEDMAKAREKYFGHSEASPQDMAAAIAVANAAREGIRLSAKEAEREAENEAASVPELEIEASDAAVQDSFETTLRVGRDKTFAEDSILHECEAASDEEAYESGEDEAIGGRAEKAADKRNAKSWNADSGVFEPDDGEEYDGEEYDDDEYGEPERKGLPFFFKFLIVLIVLAAVFEGGLLLLKHFAPESAAASAGIAVEDGVAHIFKSGTDWVSRTFDSFRKKHEDKNSENVEEGLDLSDLVQTYNRNIQIVVQDTGLARKPGTEYPIQGFADMQTVEDEELIKKIYSVLIAYNSAWIDYVNDLKEDCLDYLKADGPAYRNASNYDRVGKIKESFDRLALGEVIADGDKVYVFDSETITVTQDGEGTPNNYSLIYELVSVGDEYKIVGYSKY